MRYITPASPLEQARRAKGKPQWQVAQEVKISESRYGRIERGFVYPTVAEADRLAEVLGIEPADIYESVEVSQAMLELQSYRGGV